MSSSNYIQSPRNYYRLASDLNINMNTYSQKYETKILPIIRTYESIDQSKSKSKTEFTDETFENKRPHSPPKSMTLSKIDQRFTGKNMDYPVIEQIYSSKMPNLNESDQKNPNKKLKLWDNFIEMKLIAERYKTQGLVTPVKNDIAKIFQTLSQLIMENSPLSEHMKFVLHLLKMAIYFNPKVLKPYLDHIKEFDNEEIRALIDPEYKSKVPYYTILQLFINETVKMRTLLIKNNDEYQLSIKKMQEKIDEQNDTIQKLLTENEEKNHITNQYTEFPIEIQKLKSELQKSHEENQHLNQLLQDSLKKNDSLHNDIIQHLRTIKENKIMIDYVCDEKLKIMENINQIKEKYNQLKLKSSNLKEIFDKVIVKLLEIKNEVLTLRKENEDLLFQKDKLAMRAAVGFENLTPRPDYAAMIKEKNIDLCIISQKSSIKNSKEIKMSTVQFFEAFLQKYVELNSKCLSLENDNSFSTKSNKEPHSARQRIIRSKTIIVKDSQLKNIKDDPTEKKRYSNQPSKSSFAVQKSFGKNEIDQTDIIDPKTPTSIPNDIITPRYKIEIPALYDNSSFGEGIIERADVLMSEMIDAKQRFGVTQKI